VIIFTSRTFLICSNIGEKTKKKIGKKIKWSRKKVCLNEPKRSCVAAPQKKMARIKSRIENNGARLEEILAPYTRITIDEACRANLKMVHVDVWVYMENAQNSSWVRLPEAKKKELWSMQSSDSLCKKLVTNMSKASPLQYISIKKAAHRHQIEGSGWSVPQGYRFRCCGTVTARGMECQ
jgi:hypothetical protein